MEIDSITKAVFRKGMRLMGNRFEISVVAEEQDYAMKCIDDAVAEIKRIERLLTTFDDNSQTNEINWYAGVKPVKVDREVFDLIQRSIRISQLTQGAFDISYGSIDKSLWNFDTHMISLPDAIVARSAVKLINYKNIVLDAKECTVFLRNPGMRIGFGGIGKGYAAERAKELLKKAGIKSGIVNASGDLAVWGTQPNGKLWTIGIADPERSHLPFADMDITNAAIATSGNYEKYAIINGKKYSHTIDPKTGMPIQGIKSVTIICPNAELADAMATPISVMGIDAGLDLINQMHGIACIIVDDDNRLYTSHNIKLAA